jgi:hypothetical protein
MVQASADISRVNNPAVLNATAEAATIREPADLAPSPVCGRVNVTDELMALGSLVIVFALLPGLTIATCS